MKLVINIQSVSDIITNSSSEIFVVRTDKSTDYILEILKKIKKDYEYTGDWEDWPKMSREEQQKYDYATGEGGCIEVLSFDDNYQEFLEEMVAKNKRHLFTKEMYSLLSPKSIEEQEKEITIYIDNGFSHTIDWILENLYVTDCSWPVIKDNEGRVIRKMTWEEYDNLEDTVD